MTFSLRPQKITIWILSLVFVLASAGCQKPDKAAIKVGPLKVSRVEFEQAFKASELPNEPEYRRIFMEQYVNQKLILMEARKEGVDKDPQLLDDLQKYWQDRLLKASMLLKFEEYEKATQASDEEVDQIYQETRGNQSLPEDPQQAKDQIRLMIVHEKQNKLLVDWLASLRKKTDVYVDEQQLGLN